ncbi:MAG: DUF2341 domain-containing protein, partial [Candidatus Thermoplasmatota archaeon]|nr:DUF2341 domain-containing protein [Candidatus Thermoplasmatota archaeon]
MKRDRNIFGRKTFVLGIVAIFITSAFIPQVGSQIGSFLSSELEVISIITEESVDQIPNSEGSEGDYSDDNVLLSFESQKEVFDHFPDKPPDNQLERDDLWWNNDWSYRKEIAVNHTLVATTLVNFPVLISFGSDDDLKTHCQPNGDDIVFTTHDGIKLHHEIEYFDDGTGKLVCWVNVTYLFGEEDTVLYMYYGNSSCSNQENVLGTWDTDYVMVQHLNETTGTHYDSTLYDNNAIEIGGVTQDASGVIDGCDSFDNVNDFLSVADDDILSFGDGVSDRPFSVSAWIFTESHGSLDAIIGKDADASNREWDFLTISGKLRFLIKHNGGGNQQSYDSTNSVPLNTWTYVVGTYDGRGGSTAYQGIQIYMDGSAETLTNPVVGTYTAMANTNAPVTIGRYFDSNTFTGLMVPDQVQDMKFLLIQEEQIGKET